MRLILHAGTHKTGTTSIQAALAENRDWLRARGFVYPQLPECSNSHNHFAHGLALAEEAAIGRFRDQLRAVAVPNHSLILSAEEFSARIVGTRHWDGFDGPDYWERRHAYLERMASICSDFDGIVVWLCYRPHDEYAAALYATNLMSDRFRWSFREFRERCAPLFDYAAQVEAFRGHFDDVRIVRFAHLKPDIVGGFLTRCGIPVPPEAARHTKPTPDARLVSWLYERTTPEEDAAAHRLKAQFIRTEKAQSALASLQTKAKLWESPEVRDDFLAGCRAPEPGFFGPDPAWADAAGPSSPSKAEFARLDRSFAIWKSSPRQDRPLRTLAARLQRAMSRVVPLRSRT